MRQIIFFNQGLSGLSTKRDTFSAEQQKQEFISFIKKYRAEIDAFIFMGEALQLWQFSAKFQKIELELSASLEYLESIESLKNSVALTNSTNLTNSENSTNLAQFANLANLANSVSKVNAESSKSFVSSEQSQYEANTLEELWTQGHNVLRDYLDLASQYNIQILICGLAAKEYGFKQDTLNKVANFAKGKIEVTPILIGLMEILSYFKQAQAGVIGVNYIIQSKQEQKFKLVQVKNTQEASFSFDLVLVIENYNFEHQLNLLHHLELILNASDVDFRCVVLFKSQNFSYYKDYYKKKLKQLELYDIKSFEYKCEEQDKFSLELITINTEQMNNLLESASAVITV